MNSNYHYFTVKTLSRKAGFPEKDAQQIAYYSQQVDDFILYPPLFLEGAAGEAKLKNGGAELAVEITQSGSAIRNYGLKILETIMISEASGMSYRDLIGRLGIRR